MQYLTILDRIITALDCIRQGKYETILSTETYLINFLIKPLVDLILIKWHSWCNEYIYALTSFSSIYFYTCICIHATIDNTIKMYNQTENYETRFFCNDKKQEHKIFCLFLWIQQPFSIITKCDRNKSYINIFWKQNVSYITYVVRLMNIHSFNLKQ